MPLLHLKCRERESVTLSSYKNKKQDSKSSPLNSHLPFIGAV